MECNKLCDEHTIARVSLQSRPWATGKGVGGLGFIARPSPFHSLLFERASGPLIMAVWMHASQASQLPRWDAAGRMEIDPAQLQSYGSHLLIAYAVA